MKALALSALLLAGLAGAPGKAAVTRDPAIAVSLDHIAIKVEDQERSIRFYEDVFGLKEGPTAFAPGGPRWIPVGHGASLHIQSGRNGVVPPKTVHFSLAVPDMDAFVAHLRARKLTWQGYEGQIGKIDDRRNDHIKQIYIQDPDGYWIEVNDALRYSGK